MAVALIHNEAVSGSVVTEAQSHVRNCLLTNLVINTKQPVGIIGMPYGGKVYVLKRFNPINSQQSPSSFFPFTGCIE